MTYGLFNILLTLWIAFGVILFPVLIKVTAPYGRHSKTGWGPMINNRLSWFIMEIPALLVFLVFVVKGGGYTNKAIFIITILWTIHYAHRSVVFPFRIQTKRKKMPLLVMLFAVFFNLINGFFNGYWFGYLSSGYASDWFTDPRFITGVLLFIAGFFINQFHDSILLRLRKKNKYGYQIPRGGLFSYVSCPNYLGEIIEWGGFALLTWSLPAFSFFIWTIVNLIPRAIDHHNWYHHQFENYPKGRKAVFPGIL